jgi:hypothetical protein
MVTSNLQLHVLRICVMSGKKSRVKERKRTRADRNKKGPKLGLN